MSKHSAETRAVIASQLPETEPATKAEPEVRTISVTSYRCMIAAMCIFALVVGYLGVEIITERTNRRAFIDNQLRQLACAMVAPYPDTIPYVKTFRNNYHCPPYDPRIQQQLKTTPPTMTKTVVPGKSSTKADNGSGGGSSGRTPRSGSTNGAQPGPTSHSAPAPSHPSAPRTSSRPKPPVTTPNLPVPPATTPPVIRVCVPVLGLPCVQL